jgi:hypothetical protein
MIRTTALSLVLLGPLGCSDSPAPEPPPASGDIVTLAGTGEQATDPVELGEGDQVPGIPARKAHLDSPLDATFAADGTLLVIDWNGHKIRKLSGDGNLYPVVGSGFEGDGCEDESVDGACPGVRSRVNHPADVTFRSDGALIIAAWHNSKVKMLDTDGVLTDLCGSGGRDYLGDGGPCYDVDGAELVTFDLPSGVVFDTVGNLFIADQANQVIRRLGTDGIVKTVCGQCPDGGFGCPEGIGYEGDGGPALEARLNSGYSQAVLPAGKLAFDGEGALYLADTMNHVIRRVLPGPDGVLGDGDPAEELIETVAGTGTKGYAGDGGPAMDADLNLPTDVAFAPDGALFIADRGNHCIRRVDTEGVITTAAGRCGVPGRGGDGDPAPSAFLDEPFGVTVAPDGGLLIADTMNHRIRKVLP